jgi:hypothetical protein
MLQLLQQLQGWLPNLNMRNVKCGSKKLLNPECIMWARLKYKAQYDLMTCYVTLFEKKNQDRIGYYF